MAGQSALGKLLNSASLQLNFMTPGVLDPRITFTRASTGTYFDSAGVMQTAGVNAPRWDYDPQTLQLRGLSIEEQRVNLILNSQFASNWAGGDSFVTPNVVQSPDGGTTGARFSEGGTAATAHYITQSVAKAASSITYAISVFVKSGSGNRNLQFQIDDGGTNGFWVIINPVTGAAVTAITPFGTGWSATAHTFTPVNNGWNRIAFTVTTGVQTGIRTVLFLANGTNSTYNGDNASNVLMYGFQLEQGAFPTSYIPTTGSAVTRAADAASIPTNASWFNASTMSLQYEFAQRSNVGRQIGGVGDNDFNNALYMSTGGAGEFVMTRAGGGGANTSTVLPPNVPHKGMSSFSTTRHAACADGAPVVATVVSQGPLIATRMAIGCTPWALDNAMSGWMRRVQYWNRMLSDIEMRSASTL